MKLTTASAAAVAASGAAAQSSWTDWASWSSSSTSTKGPVQPTTQSCPATLTVLKTKTATVWATTSEVYQKTITVPIPDKPSSVNINPVWAQWTSSVAPVTTSAWSQWSGTASPASTSSAPCYSLPSGCTAQTTVQATTTVTSTQPGCTTITKSTLFLGVSGYTGAPAGAQPTGGNNNGWNGNNNGGNGNGWNGNNNEGNNNNNDNGGGLVSGLLNGVNSVGSNFDVLTWIPEAPTNTKTGVAPLYTKRPDGGYGGNPYGEGEPWLDWTVPDPNSGNNGGSGGGNNGNGGGNGPHGGYTNGTSGVNGTSGCQPGDACSNVTKPFSVLADSTCNTPTSRNLWCDGKDTSFDYYTDYFTQNTCSYDLTITNGTANWDGDDRLAFLINGQYEGPAIECNWGDTVKITVHNQLSLNGTSIHFHGVRQVGTNDQDGVPGITECGIAPGQSRTYTWIASSYGTSWYHSHWATQYGEGVRGPIIIHGPATANYDIDAGPVMLSDTVNGTVAQQGWVLAHFGLRNTVNWLMNGHNVAYDLSSGQHPLWTVKPGKKYLFRIINAAVQNMFSVSIDSHKMQVIAADFVPIVPYETDFLDIGIGQRYDVVVNMDQAVDSYFFRAITQTRCPSGCQNTGLGSANGIIAYEGVPSSPYYLPTSTVNDGKTLSDFATCNDEPLASLVPFLPKTAGTQSAFVATESAIDAGTITQNVSSTGDAVFRWTLNGNNSLYVNYNEPTLKALSDGVPLNSDFPNYIELTQKDQWYYFVIENQFYTGHPMHLHGHDFSVLGQGQSEWTSDLSGTLNFVNPIRRDTAMLQGAERGPGPYGYTVIGFQSDNPGAWLMHCHIAWHVDEGLGLQWIERPDDMKATYDYWQTSDFASECSAYASYSSQFPEDEPQYGSSGLRKRGENLFFDAEVARMNSQHHNVVRRDSHGAHHYLDSHMKRGLGDNSRRHFGRRR